MSANLLFNENWEWIVTHAFLVENGTSNFALEINPYYSRLYWEDTLSHIWWKVKTWETFLQAIVREVEEETDLLISSDRFIQYKEIIEVIEGVKYCSQTYLANLTSEELKKTRNKQSIKIFNPESIHRWDKRFLTEKESFISKTLEFLEETKKYSNIKK